MRGSDLPQVGAEIDKFYIACGVDADVAGEEIFIFHSLLAALDAKHAVTFGESTERLAHALLESRVEPLGFADIFDPKGLARLVHSI